MIRFTVRLAAHYRLNSEAELRPKRADIVAKVFLGCGTKILRAADAFYARRREGPYHPKSITDLGSGAEKRRSSRRSKDQLSRDFPGCSIFDFCNNIGTFRDFVAVYL
jgi:hypothetical protein